MGFLNEVIEKLEIELIESNNEDYSKGLSKAISIIRNGDFEFKTHILERIEQLDKQFDKYQEKYMKEKYQGTLSLQFFGEVVSAINCKKELEKILKLERL